MAELGKRASVAVSWIGKVKTVFQMVALAMLLWLHSVHIGGLKLLAVALLYIAASLTVWSMCLYLKLAWPDLNASRKISEFK
jgi:CDP-diacylglycerol---glycerol-3-phosphate 3-phosphatidyltransferase